MLSIIINHYNHSISSIEKYISFLQNIIHNHIIELVIINSNEEINNINIENINPNLTISIYNYSSKFNDSLYNDILNFITYDKVLFTNYDVYFTNILFDWIYNNNINNKTYIKTNIFTLKSLPEQFFSNFSNSIYNHISENIMTISNESGLFNIDSNTFIDIFNKDKQLRILDTKTILDNDILFINNTNDFLLINKNTIKNIGFNINNFNYNYSFQYLTISFIKNNFEMIKLPYLLSVFKLFTENQQNELFIDINKEFNNSTEYNKFINYKIYNLNTKKTSSYIRNQIKTIKGYNTATTVQENESLKKKINELTSIIEKYKNNNNLNNTIEENTKLNNEQTNHLIEENKNLIEENKNLIEENTKLNNEQTNYLIEENKNLIEENKNLIEENKNLIEENTKLNNEQTNHLIEENKILLHKNSQLLNDIKNLKNDILLKLYDIINFDLDK